MITPIAPPTHRYGFYCADGRHAYRHHVNSQRSVRLRSPISHSDSLRRLGDLCDLCYLCDP